MPEIAATTVFVAAAADADPWDALERRARQLPPAATVQGGALCQLLA